ncbi:hypothetical protein G9A89_001069 [Geosiphon pyriformis]|nr:hypothetical protein G9A89_001069 [Geosiphon pyriformis]
MHSVDLQATVTNTRDFEAVELEANHAQAVNLVINGSSDLDSKLKQFNDSINQKLEEPRTTQQSWRLVIVVHQLISSSSTQTSGSQQQNLDTKYTQNPNAQHYLSLLVTPKDVSFNNQEPNQNKLPTSNIPSTTITNNESLAAIFPFEYKELSQTPLFSGAALKEKPITVMYTNAKVNSQAIKLILDSGSVGSIITRQLMDQLSH